MDFSGASTQQFGNGELIPKGTLCWGVLHIQRTEDGSEVTRSQSSESQYLNVDVTIEGGQYDKRHLFDKIGVYGSEKWVQAGQAAIRHILEVGKNANPGNPSGYVIQSYGELDGLRVAFKVGIEKGSAGYEDKNNLRYLSPNPESDTHKDFNRLVAGDTAPAAPPPAAAPATPSWQTPAAPASAGTPAAAPQAAAPPPAAGPGNKPSWLPR